jgi:serine/threonine protein kinase
MPLAFKRFHESGDSDLDFLPLMSEVLILSQPPIQNHPNIINLKGICWEIKPRTERAVPVLVFEKAAWDLKQYMNVREGMGMSIKDRLKVCAEIASAIMALHTYGLSFQIISSFKMSNMDADVIHGDIKPQNVLVFKDTTGKTIVKVADFGYSTLNVGEAGKVLLPKSRPWNAPEHHFGDFKVSEAKKTDVYSFGILCLWVLFGYNLSHIPSYGAKSVSEVVSFEASTGPRTSLEQLKDADKLEHFANQLIDSIPFACLDAEYRVYLKEFFSLTVPLNPEKRTVDLGKLVGLLSREQ